MHKPAVHAGAEAAGEVIRRRAPIQAHCSFGHGGRGFHVGDVHEQAVRCDERQRADQGAAPRDVEAPVGHPEDEKAPRTGRWSTQRNPGEPK